MDCSRLRSKTGRRAVTDKQREVLRAFARRVIPGGDGWPDGAEAECEDYVSRLLAGDWAHKQDEFLAGLERLADAEFAELAAAAQDALLAEVRNWRAGWLVSGCECAGGGELLLGRKQRGAWPGGRLADDELQPGD